MRGVISLRLIIVGLIAGGMLPVLMFGGVLVYRTVEGARELIKSNLQRETSVLAATLERELLELQEPMFVLAGSEALHTGDVKAFRAQAAALAERAGYILFLNDRTGQELMNTRVPEGQKLPMAAPLETIKLAIQTRRPGVSGVVIAPVDNSVAATIVVPVTIGSDPGFSLGMNVIRAVNAIVAEQHIAKDSVVTVVDAAGLVVARMPPTAGAAGSRSTFADVAMPLQLDHGSFSSVNRDGIARYTAYNQVGNTGWSVLLGANQATLFAPVGALTDTMLALGGGALLLAMIIAGLIGQRLHGWVGTLSTLTTSLGHGQVLPPLPPSGITEIDAAVASLSEASRLIHNRTAEREAALDALKQEVSDRRRAEAQLVQAQKMEAVGLLTSGIAHDFNNILAAVVGSMELANEDESPDSQRADVLREGIAAAMRGSELTRRLLAFSRQQQLAPQPVDLNALVSGMTTLLSRTLGGNFTIYTSLHRGLWVAHADPSQVQDALLNLCINARDAMWQGGVLDIETANVTIDATSGEESHDAMHGDYVVLCVTDNGIGMSPEIISRAVEPFFTTKEVGRGSGLGLSMVYGFAKQSAGHLRITSEIGAGTSVKLYLPRDIVQVQTVATVEPEQVSSRGAETVLVVEDLDPVRKVTCRALASLGYHVLEAANAQEALDIVDRGDPIDLLFTDIIMPGGLTGRDLAEEVRKRRPHLPVLFTSGYAGDTLGEEISLAVNILPKPYRRQELARSVREALETLVA